MAPFSDAKAQWDTDRAWYSAATPSSVSASKLCNQVAEAPPPPPVLVNDEPLALSAIRSSTADGAACNALMGASTDTAAAVMARVPLAANLIAAAPGWS